MTSLEILVVISGLTVSKSLSLTRVRTNICVPIAGYTSLLAIVATLLTNEYFSKLKLRYTKLKDWINMITILYEKTLIKSMID